MMNDQEAIYNLQRLFAAATAYAGRVSTPGSAPVTNIVPQSLQSQEKQPAITETEWKEYRTAEGRIFWFNSKTNKSTWEKPEELRTDSERILATCSSWREVQQEDGKTYWHNSETKESEWETPTEVKQLQESLAILDAEDWSHMKIEGKSDARSKFRELLERKGIGHLATWDLVQKVLVNDPKWAVFNNVLTKGERKHVFNEFVNAMIKKHKEEQRMRKVMARDSLSEYMQAWRNGENGQKRMEPDAKYEDLPNRPEWRVLEARERFEIFEEVATQVAAGAIQKCSANQAEEITNWFKLVRHIVADDSSLNEIIEFTRKYYPHDLTDVNDLSICQQWKSLLTNSNIGVADDEPLSPSQKVFKYEAETRQRFRDLLKACEENELLNAKTEAQKFWRLRIPNCEEADELKPVGVNEAVDGKRTQILNKVKTNVLTWLAKNDENVVVPRVAEEGSVVEEEAGEAKEDTHPICLDNRFLSVYLQGGSSVLEMFNDYVYVLWDLYEVVRDEAKGKIREGVLKSEDDMEKWIEGLEEKFKRKGVLIPLRQYCLKRIERSNATTEEEEEDEEGREKGEIVETHMT